MEPMITEAINNRDINKAHELIASYLKKKGGYVINHVRSLSENGKKWALLGFTSGKLGFAIVWKQAQSSYIDSVLFADNFIEMFDAWNEGRKYKFALKVETNGLNTAAVAKLIGEVASGRLDLDAYKIEQFGQGLFGVNENILESVHWRDGLTQEEINKIRMKLYNKVNNLKKKGSIEDVEAAQQELDEFRAAVAENKGKVTKNVVVSLDEDAEAEKWEKILGPKKELVPEEKFDMMNGYIQMVIKGTARLALICGAPGVGKTYRIMKEVEGAGFKHGDNLGICKGRMTPMSLYKIIYDYRNPGDLLVFDDCDDALKSEDTVNLIKAAYDSSAKRLVSYNTSTPIKMEETKREREHAELNENPPVLSINGEDWAYPSIFTNYSGGIIITNFQAGSIDTAIKNRAVICDLYFTTKEILEIVRGIIDKIDSAGLTTEGKDKALVLLEQMVDADIKAMEISIRSFMTCAQIFSSCDNDSLAKNMIREQMSLQFSRAKKSAKY